MRRRSLAAVAMLLALPAVPAWGQTGGLATGLYPPGGSGWGGAAGSSAPLDVGPRYPPDPDTRRGRRHRDDWTGPPAGGWGGPDWFTLGPVSPPASFLVPAVPLPGLADTVPPPAPPPPPSDPAGVAPAGAVAPPGTVVAPPVSPPSARYWYWCADPRGYYPAVPICNGPWRPLAATQTR